MLSELHVKNLALIEKADVEFKEGLNVLTGETGAGKSIIIGSVTIALGGKVPKNMIRNGAEYAYIELIFTVCDPRKIQLLKEMDVYPDQDGIVIISKKIMPSKSLSKINDETVTSGKLREITGLLIDIHGQHEHQSLLYKKNHLTILDAFAKENIKQVKEKLAKAYLIYKEQKEELEEALTDEKERNKEIGFLEFEIQEIRQAKLSRQEDETLEELAIIHI